MGAVVFFYPKHHNRFGDPFLLQAIMMGVGVLFYLSPQGVALSLAPRRLAEHENLVVAMREPNDHISTSSLRRHKGHGARWVKAERQRE